MKIEKLAAIGEITSSVAILITLIYLAIETEQNTTAIESTARQQQFQRDTEFIMELSNNSEIWVKMSVGDELSADEQFKVHTMWLSQFRNLELLYVQFMEGVIDGYTWESQKSIINFMLNERMLKWWENSGRKNFSTEFVSLVDGEIANSTLEPEYWVSQYTWDN